MIGSSEVNQSNLIGYYFHKLNLDTGKIKYDHHEENICLPPLDFDQTSPGKRSNIVVNFEIMRPGRDRLASAQFIPNPRVQYDLN